MAADKYLSIDTDGNHLEVQATDTSAGVGNAGDIVALGNDGLISTTMLPSDGAVTATASEAIAAGDLINFHNSSGLKVRKATNAGPSTRAHGYAPASISSAASGTVVVFRGVNTAVSGLTVGENYMLGTAGGVVSTAPTASGSVIQHIGVARSATELEVNITSGPLIKRA